MVYLTLGFIGCLLGAMGFRHSGWFFGLVLGLLATEMYTLRKRLSHLEKGMKIEKRRLEKSTVHTPAEGPPPARSILGPRADSRPSQGTLTTGQKETKPSPEPISVLQTTPPPVTDSAQAFSEIREDGPDTGTDLPSRLFNYVKSHFTTGNVVTKIGVVVLFFGFAFLLKYAAQRNMIPIQFRLTGVFIAGMGLLITGWRLRVRKELFGLLLQGGGIGVVYLTVYAAARFYGVLPLGFSFVAMFCIVILSGILSVLQDAKCLALFGVVGGFLAPILMSTGAGSHVVLFSYYALLNFGIVGIAWNKAWRELNLIGFAFTFVIASIWGGKYYQPHYFSSTEPFLILFFLYYVAVSILYALRQPMSTNGFVDGTLVFGLPLVAFGLQYGLVRNFEYGLAISAMNLGLFYILLATILWRRRIEKLRMLIESFLALGVVFGSLAIPLALDGRWTSAAWAIEGGAVFWIGIRQNRILPRIFGLLLQAGSGISFILSAHQPPGQIPVANSFFAGCTLISLSGFFSSWHVAKRCTSLNKWECHAEIPLMIWGLAWWFGAGFVEIERFVSGDNRAAAIVTHAALSFLLMDVVSHRLSWKQLTHASILLLPLMAIGGFSYPDYAGKSHLLTLPGWIAWSAAFCVQYRLLFKCEEIWPKTIVSLWHILTMWLLVFILTRESAYFLRLLLPGSQTWEYCIWGIIPGIAIGDLLYRGKRLSWPLRRFQDVYLGYGSAIPVIYFFVWALWANFHHGQPAPLPYFPVLNPLELSQIYLLILVVKWLNRQEAWLQRMDLGLNVPVLKMAVHTAGFILLNAMVARTIHFRAHVPYTAAGLFRSLLLQAAISILWGVTALAITLWSTRKGSRPAWIAGATILSMVVIKLFIVDLAGTGTIARIVSFLGVGSLMLIIGYFSPLPPARIR